MTDIEQLSQQHRRTFILICSNFIMFLVLFFALGLVVWKSATLVSKINEDLARAERAVAELQQRIQYLNFETLMEKVVSSAGESIRSSLKTAINESNFSASLNTLSNRIEGSQAKLEQVGQSLQEANTKLQKINADELAQLISYHMLARLGEGFNSAAEARKPVPATVDPDDPAPAQ